jgi:hypothetical protein
MSLASPFRVFYKGVVIKNDRSACCSRDKLKLKPVITSKILVVINSKTCVITSYWS